jgi:hypothetical protein
MSPGAESQAPPRTEIQSPPVLAMYILPYILEIAVMSVPPMRGSGSVELCGPLELPGRQKAIRHRRDLLKEALS